MKTSGGSPQASTHDRVRSVVLLSGGLDSAVNLALCRLRDEPVLAITVDYGQRAARRELESARALCALYGVEHRALDLSWLGALGSSALTHSERDVPELETRELDQRSVTEGSARAVWVPNRNGLLIHAAAAFGESLGARRVVVGFNFEEAQTFPDNSEAYLKAETKALAYSTGNQLEVFSYTVAWDKTRIVSELRAHCPEFPFDRLWSCYQGGETPCGACESCRRLARAVGGQTL